MILKAFLTIYALGLYGHPLDDKLIQISVHSMQSCLFAEVALNKTYLEQGLDLHAVCTPVPQD